MRALVTGGAGFIGSHLVDRLVKDGHEVNVLDNLSTGKTDNLKDHLEPERLSFIQGDIRDRKIVNESLIDVDCLVHLAAITNVPFSVTNAGETFSVNVAGTENLLRASVESKVRKVIFAVSCAVYGEPDYVPVDEEHPWNPISPYAAMR